MLLVAWLLVFILVEESKPVLSGKRGKLKRLQEIVSNLENQVAKLGECKGA